MLIDDCTYVIEEIPSIRVIKPFTFSSLTKWLARKTCTENIMFGHIQYMSPYIPIDRCIWVVDPI